MVEATKKKEVVFSALLRQFVGKSYMNYTYLRGSCLGLPCSTGGRSTSTGRGDMRKGEGRSRKPRMQIEPHHVLESKKKGQTERGRRSSKLSMDRPT